MADNAPGATELFGAVVKWCDEIVPGDFSHGCFQFSDNGFAAIKQGSDSRRDMFRTDSVEQWKTFEIQQWIGHRVLLQDEIGSNEKGTQLRTFPSGWPVIVFAGFAVFSRPLRWRFPEAW